MPDQKIAFFITNLNGGGVERTILNLCQGFLEKGIEPHLIVLRLEGELKGIIPKGAKLHVLNEPGFLRSVRPLAQVLRTENPQAIVSATPLANAVTVIARWIGNRQCKVITTDHTNPHLGHFPKGKAKKTITPILTRLTYPHADAIIAVSDGVGDELAKILRMPRQRIQTIYNAVDLSPTNSDPDHPWIVERKNGGKLPTIVAAGRLVYQKDYPTLINAAADLKKQGLQFRMVIFGEGPERTSLQALIDQENLCDSVDLPGFSENVRAEMASADLYVMSSQFEGLGNVLIEALAEGCSVVSTDCPSGPAEILQYGRLGKLVPVGDHKVLASAILQTLEGETTPVTKEDLNPFSFETAVLSYANAAGISI